MTVSYEVPMVIALLVPVILARSMSMQDIVNQQSIWYIVAAPIAALIFLISAIAELGRAPFDLAEAESEIVAGFHIEYTGMKFGMFYAGELLHALTMGALFSTFFLGGWRGPCVEQVPDPWACLPVGQSLLPVLGDHVGEILVAAHPHRPYAEFQLEIPDPAGAGRGDGDRHPG